MQRGRQLVAVFADRAAAERAAEAVRPLVHAGAMIRLDAQEDQVRALRGEMREETGNVGGAGPVATFTPEMVKGIIPFVAVCAVLGALLAAPFSAIAMDGLDPWARVALCVIVGALAGAVFGFVAGGRRGARASSGELAADTGVTLGIPAEGEEIVELERVLRACAPLRVDVIHGEQPVATLTTEHGREAGSTAEDMAEKLRTPLEPHWRDDGSTPA